MNQASDHSRSTIIVQALHSALGLFKVRREERRLAWGALLYALVLNTMIVCRYWEWFSQVTDGYRKLVLRHFHISGFDPITYLVLNDWSAAYNIYRHPLLAFFMWIPAQINHLIILVTGVNFAQVLTAMFLVAATFYAVLFLFRILREIVSLPATDALLLTLLFLSFAYTMVSLSVPDHFGLSTTALILTLYVAGRSLLRGRPLTKAQTVLFFLLTAGISLNNGIKVFLASWGTSGKRFFRPAHLLQAVIVPSALIWGFARWEWQTFEKPKYLARQEATAAREKKERGAIMQNLIKQSATTDTTGLSHTADSIFRARAKEKERRRMKKAVYALVGIDRFLHPATLLLLGPCAEDAVGRWERPVVSVVADCLMRFCMMAPRSFFSRAAVASWRARYFGFSNVCHSQRANPHISADGTITACSRWAGRKNRLPLVPQLARKTLMPLLSEMPAVSRKNSTVCAFVSGLPRSRLRPAT